MLKIGFKAKFLLFSILIVVFISFAFLVFFIIKSASLVKEELSEIGFSLVKSLAYSAELGVASEDEIFLKPSLDRIFSEKEVLLTAVYNKQGKIILSSKKAELEEAIPEKIFNEITQNKTVSKASQQTAEGEQVYDFYAPVFSSEILTIGQKDNFLVGFARVSLSLERVNEQNKEIIIFGLAITVFLIFCGMVFSFFLAEHLIRPINALRQGAEIIGRGSLDHQINIKTGDELESLSRSFNQMAQALKKSHIDLEDSKKVLEIKVKSRTKELEELNQNLNSKVEERTRELQQRIDELERFRKLTVGRELKMLELKKQVKEYQQEIDRLLLAKTEPKKIRKKRSSKK